MLFTEHFFNFLFTLPGGFQVGLIVGLLVGAGSMGLSLSYRAKQLLESTGFPVRRYADVWLLLGTIFVVVGLLLFIGLLVAFVSLRKTLLDNWTLLFVATSLIIVLVITIPIVAVRRRLKKVLIRQRRDASSVNQPSSE